MLILCQYFAWHYNNKIFAIFSVHIIHPFDEQPNVLTYFNITGWADQLAKGVSEAVFKMWRETEWSAAMLESMHGVKISSLFLKSNGREGKTSQGGLEQLDCDMVGLLQTMSLLVFEWALCGVRYQKRWPTR